MDYEAFVECVRGLRCGYDFSVTSWWRSVKRNRAVGGHPKSKHLRGLAVDVVLDSPAADKEGFVTDCVGLGLKAIDEGDHIHVQIR